MKLKYTTDICGNEILCDESEIHQVMMEWERPYMEYSINKFNPKGRVLELGFGMGYSASKICETEMVTEYNVIECSPVVWEKFEIWKENMQKIRPELKINLIKGRWEDVLTMDMGIFDDFYFDDYNGNISEIASRFPSFLLTVLKNNVKINSRICCYSTTNYNRYSNIECLSYEVYNYDIKIPDHCVYAKGNSMYIPIWTVNSEASEGDCKNLTNDPFIKNREIMEKIKSSKETSIKTPSIYCNLMIIDNFYTNAFETRQYILQQEFSVKGNYPGQRTNSYATNNLKNIIEGYIHHFAGKIIDWSTDPESYNGSYQYTTSRDRTWIHTDGTTNWAGVLYLTPHAPVTSGTGIFRHKDGTKTIYDSNIRNNQKKLDEDSQDYTKWELVDRVGNVFNRLVLFNSKQYHASLDYFGSNKENGRLFQVFFFSTER